MQNLGYMFAAFVIIWIALFVYVFALGQRQKQLRRDIDHLKGMLKDKGQ